MCLTLKLNKFYALQRYHSLQEPMQIRRDNLEDALLLHQFLRDADDELQWIAEKEPLAASTDLGTSLVAVQSLQKKHQVCYIDFRYKYILNRVLYIFDSSMVGIYIT